MNILDFLEEEVLAEKRNPAAKVVRMNLELQRIRVWTAEEEAFLEKNLARLGMQETARILGRSEQAVKIRQHRKGFHATLRHPAWYTRSQISKLLGVDVHAVMQWHKLGLLAFEEAPVSMERRQNNEIWRISASLFRRWALDPWNWPLFYYRPGGAIREIPDPWYCRLLALKHERWGDEWLTIGAAARMLNAQCTHLVNKRIHQGILAGRQWGNWWLRRSEVERYLAEHGPIPRGRGVPGKKRGKQKKAAA